MTGERLEPFFLNTGSGRIFALYRTPDGAKRCVLFVPPFAEEMNKSRRQFSEMSRVLNEKGFATLVIDLFGTGDSDGEFADVTWAAWKENLQSAFSWVKENGIHIDTLIATRLGCVLAAETLGEYDAEIRKTVFWQPVVNGRQFMTQFLRLRVAASMMSDDSKENVENLRASLTNGQTLQVAGYELSPRMWSDIESADLLQRLNKKLGHIMIAEIGRPRDDGLSPVGKKLENAAGQLDIRTHGYRVEGEPFWSATEIVVNEDLVQSTAEFVASNQSP